MRASALRSMARRRKPQRASLGLRPVLAPGARRLRSGCGEGRASGAMTARSLRVEKSRIAVSPHRLRRRLSRALSIPGSSVSTDVSRRSQDGYAWISSPWT